MKKIAPGVLAGLVATAVLAAPALAGPTATMRVEGGAQTLVPRTAVTTTTTPVGKPAQPACDGTSALGVLDRATGGDWSGPYFAGLGYAPETIKGETHDVATSTYWAFWINYTIAPVGLCGHQVQEGDDLLLVPDCYAPGCAPGSPLRLSGVPATVAPGTPVAVTVDEFTASTSGPAAGATISYGNRTATTAADGTAQLTFSGSGPLTVQATKPDRIRSAVETTCITTGSDRACGSQMPSGAPAQPATPATPVDQTAPTASFTRLRNGKVFSRKRAPRELAGSVTPDPSGLLSVRLSILRKHKGRCTAFDGATERFKRHRCGGRRSFRIGDRADWSYLLPRKLRKGRYTIRVAAIDKRGNDSVTTAKIRVR